MYAHKKSVSSAVYFAKEVSPNTQAANKQQPTPVRYIDPEVYILKDTNGLLILAAV